MYWREGEKKVIVAEAEEKTPRGGGAKATAPAIISAACEKKVTWREKGRREWMA